MKVQLQKVAPGEIEARSMEIIRSELGERTFPPEVLPVVKRVIHTTADFDYADSLVFSPGAVEKGVAALRAGCAIVTDTQMARAGINRASEGRHCASCPTRTWPERLGSGGSPGPPCPWSGPPGWTGP